ncbi:CaiB/BaiF CoA transferase family protein [Sphingomonas desiccabilis]|uniref:CoA transferase n=1 Tax=Sphingomonas desiccabilis TaxID=429134 RepID=A0A4Q2IQZ4_9SPHN|nr:CoA transferase [Sphingomonas desiccabilis]MBB3911163.1 crotonobetainyl-CoA:carnitine CoA-transferase CaiB-like acyl-CoA transferase [Sphingomonas desiccabilis]RXZ32033.1 CoA transferase [Sphingomonas desiccabilis]
MNALDGLTVVDLSHAIAGPTCTNMLVELGATVIKVEPPGTGDGFRHYTEHGGEAMLSIPFASINAGKRSIALDLKTPAGIELLWRLLERADLLVENFRPGVLARLGLDFDALHARNPRLILVSITGFGQTGPLADRGAYDHIAQAMSGIALMNTGPDGPQKIGMPIIDSFTGYLATIGFLAALRRRDASGLGEHVDVAMLDAALKLVNTTVSVHSYTGRTPGGTGNRGFRLVATSEFYPTAQGWIALGANNQQQVEALLHVLGHPELIDDPRFRSHDARVAHYPAVRAWLTETLSTWRAADLEARLAEARVPVAMLREVGEIAQHPHVLERGTLHPVALPGWDRPLDVVGPGFATETRPTSTVPTLGSDTDAILAELGLDEAAILALRRSGVVG